MERAGWQKPSAHISFLGVVVYFFAYPPYFSAPGKIQLHQPASGYWVYRLLYCQRLQSFYERGKEGQNHAIDFYGGDFNSTCSYRRYFLGHDYWKIFSVYEDGNHRNHFSYTSAGLFFSGKVVSGIRADLR